MQDMPSQTKPIVAAFDFDGTLTTSDSFHHFLRNTLGLPRFLGYLLLLSPLLVAFQLKLISNHKLKTIVLRRTIGGWSAKRLHDSGKTFAETKMDALLRPEAIHKLRWHQAQGHQTILVSASLELYLKPWTEKMGFSACCGTNLVFENNYATGDLAGRNCWGAEKTARLTALLGDLDGYELYAYGDTRGDQEMLAAATYPFYRRF